MFASLKRVAALTLAAGGLTVGGCDDVRAGDKDVQKKLDIANVVLGQAEGLTLDPGVTELDAVKPAVDALSSAATDQSASPVWRATASAAAGDVQMRIAVSQQLELNRIEQSVRAALSDLRSLGQQVALTNYLASGYAKEAPSQSQAVAGINKLVADMQGDAQNLTWGLDDKKTIRTLAVLKQAISNLQGQIVERKELISKLTRERQAAIVDAEQKFEGADKQKGAESVRVYSEAAESRRKSEEIAVKLDLTTDQLKRIEADLALALGEQAALEAGIATLQEQANSLTASSADSVTRVSNQRKLAASIATNTTEGGFAVNIRAKDLVEALQNAKAQRGKVNESLTEAAKHYGDAVTESGKLAVDSRMSSPGNADLWKGIREAVSAGRYNLPLAVTNRQLGTLSFDEAALLSEVESVRAQVTTSLRAADLAAPDGWNAVVTSELTNLVQAAEEQYKSSNELLVNINSSTATKVTSDAAMIARLITLHKLIQLQALKPTLGIVASPEEARTLQSDAQALKQEIVAAGLVLPQVPGELGEMPAVVAPVVTAADVAVALPAGDANATSAIGETRIAVQQIDEAIAAFAEAAVSGKAEDLKQRVVVDESTQPVYNAMVVYGGALVRLEEAAVEKFPELKKDFHGALVKGAAAQFIIPSAMLEVSGDDARLMGTTNALYRRENGQWKILLASTLPDGTNIAETMTSKAAAIDVVTGRLKSGEITDASVFATELRAAIMPAMP